MQLISGKQTKPVKCILYGVEGIGKSTFASRFPSPVFIDTEGSTVQMDVTRTQAPSSWTMLLEQVNYFARNKTDFQTLVIDTADWAEKLCINQFCANKKIGGIEDIPYGKGWVYVADDFAKLLHALDEVINIGMNVCITAHSQIRKVEQPDEIGNYDRWEMKLGKKTAPLLKEWADMVLFANYKTYVIAADDKGKKHKAQGGQRVMYTTHHPCWDAKNRHGLTDELKFDYSEIAHCIPSRNSAAPTSSPVKTPSNDVEKIKTKLDDIEDTQPVPPPPAPVPDAQMQGIPKALLELMTEYSVTADEIKCAVAGKGYYPYDTPIAKYEPGFIDGVLVGAWQQVFSIIKENRTVPFN